MEQARVYYELLSDSPAQQKLVFDFGLNGTIDYVYPRTLRFHLEENSRTLRAWRKRGIATVPDGEHDDSFFVSKEDALPALAWLFQHSDAFEADYDTIATCISCNVGATQHCGGCKAVAYCGTECQAAHWPVHKNHCLFNE